MLDLARARLPRARGNSNTASSCGKQQQSHEARHQETAFTVGSCSQGGRTGSSRQTPLPWDTKMILHRNFPDLGVKTFSFTVGYFVLFPVILGYQ